MQNPFSDSLGFKNPILDFLKKRTLNFLKQSCIIRCRSVSEGSAHILENIWEYLFNVHRSIHQWLDWETAYHRPTYNKLEV